MSVLLSKVDTLTLRNGRKTSHRRVPAVPQLKCVGGSGCRHYQVDVMRCKNMGYDYDENDVQWTCTASLPPEFKLGSTDVMCEGYTNSQDPKILKGSCGVEYRLILTDAGEAKFGSLYSFQGAMGSIKGKSLPDIITGSIFWILFLGIAGWFVWSLLKDCLGGSARRRGGGTTGNSGRSGGGGGGPGGGGYGHDDDDAPPPPYSRFPKTNYSKPQTTRRTPAAPRQAQQARGWQPGFLTGAATGAAAGWFAGGRGNRRTGNTQEGGGGWFGAPSRSSAYDPGVGSSGSGGSSTARYQSSGFGGTTRR